MKKRIVMAGVAAMLVGFGVSFAEPAAPTGDATVMPVAPVVKKQTMCPVMGGEVNKALYVDHAGKRIYVCCAGCIGTVKADPAKYIQKIEAEGVTLDVVPPTPSNTLPPKK